MKTKLPWVLLAISLSLNAFFVAGYLYSSQLVQQVAASEAGRTRFVARRLQLDRHQREEFRRLRALARGQAAQLRQANTEVIEAFWDERAKAQPDPQRLKELLERLSENQKAFQLAVVDLVREFMGTLRPEQREAFLKMIRRRNIFRYLMNERGMRKRVPEPMGDSQP